MTGRREDSGFRPSPRILPPNHPGPATARAQSALEPVINLKTAKVLGVKIPQSLLLRADEVIQ